MTACPRCEQSLPEGARFCPSCGMSLAAEDREERKLVSVLFIDLVGFTSRSDQADPEEVRDLLALYYEAVRQQIERFGGTLEKFIGDAVMGVFGVPTAHTDDAERAVRAALASLRALEELRAEHPGLDLAARAAVNTGEAVVRIGSGPERGEALAVGDVVNTASRLQTSAPPGRVVVGHETYRMTRDAIDYQETAPLVAKGKRDTLSGWIANVDSNDLERRLRTTAMVGRAAEMSMLASIWESVVRERQPQLVTLVGPPGMGKSTLRRAFISAVESKGGRALVGRSAPFDTADVYAPFAQQMRTVAGIHEQDAAEVARSKLSGLVDEAVPAPERNDILRPVSLLLGLGLDEPMDDQFLLFYGAKRLVEHLATQQATLLVFEDVHWSEAAQLDLIEYLAAHLRDAPVLLLALARPEFSDSRPSWGRGVHRHSTLALSPVSDETAEAIVRSAAESVLPDDVIKRVIDVAGGNPLFLEELAASLREQDDSLDNLPTTVRAAIAARLDALVPEQRRALLAASVVGSTFWLASLRALGEPGDVGRYIDALEAQDFVRRNPLSAVRGDLEYTFKHALVRDVCYATLPRSDRKAAHASVAGYLEGVLGSNKRELATILAHHYEQAGQPDRAVEYLVLAADRAREALAEREVVNLLERAERLAESEASRIHIRFLRALARVDLEDFDNAIVELEPLVDLLEGTDLVRALLGLARSYHWTEKTQLVIEAAERAYDVARSIEATEFLGPALARVSQGLAMRGEPGDLDRAVELGEKALDVWTPDQAREDLAEHEHLLADQYYWTGRYERALEFSRRARSRAVDPTSAEALLRGAGMEGLLLAAMGRYEEAIVTCDSAIALGTQLGRRVRVLLNYSTLAYREIFDLDEARRRSEEAFEQGGRSGTFHMPWMNALVDLMHTDVLAGEIGAAERWFSELWDEVRSTPAWERWLLGGKMAALRAEIALQKGDPDGAVEWAAKALELAQIVRRRKYEAVARVALGNALMATGAVEDALSHLGASVEISGTLGNPAGRWRARAAFGTALNAVGKERAAEEHLLVATQTVRELSGRLSEQRRRRFLDAPPVRELLSVTG